MSEQQDQEPGEGIVGQSASTAGFGVFGRLTLCGKQ